MNRTEHLRETARLIAEAWADEVDLPLALRMEAANTIVFGAQDRAVDVVIVATGVLEDRRGRHRHVYGWPFIDAETIDAMAVRAARVWRDREGE